MRWRFDSAALVAALLALTACDLLQPAPPDAGLPIAELDAEPRAANIEQVGGQPATGPVMQIATGEVQGGRFHFAVYKSVEGACSSFDWENGASTACGALPGGVEWSEAFGMMSFGGDGVTQNLTGIVSLDVADVWIELDSGARLSAMLLPLDAADIAANAFVAFAPAEVMPVAVVAFGDDGEVIERFEIGPAPPRDGPMPAAAAP